MTSQAKHDQLVSLWLQMRPLYYSSNLSSVATMLINHVLEVDIQRELANLSCYLDITHETIY